MNDVPHAISDLDAELDAMFACVAAPHQDQASRLRGLVADSPPPAPSPEPACAQPRAESPRFVRHTLITAARNARIVTVASGKGGVGKTSICVNLAVALAQRGLRVILLDADLGTANADLLCGVMPNARLDHVLAPGGLNPGDGGRRSIQDIAVTCPGGFKLVPGSSGVARMADLSPGERRWLLNALVELAADADVVLIDAAAGIGPDVTGVLGAADLALIVTTPEPTALADAYALVKCVSATDSAVHDGRVELAVVINQAQSSVEAFASHARFAQVCDRFLALPAPMLGFVAHDVRVAEAVRARVPLLLRTPDAPSAHNLRDLAGAVVNILGLSSPDPVRSGSSSPTSGGIRRLVRRLLGHSSPARTIGRFSTESVGSH